MKCVVSRPIPEDRASVVLAKLGIAKPQLTFFRILYFVAPFAVCRSASD